MADITSTVISPFVSQIWANTALEVLRANINLAKLVTTDSDVAAFQVGQTLHIPYTGTFVANTKTEGSNVTTQTPTATDTQVTLNKHKEVTFLVEDFAQALADTNYLRQYYMDAAVVAIAEQVETDLLALVASFSTQVGTAGTALTASTLRTVNQTFTTNKVPAGNRHIVIDPKDTASLLSDTSLQYYFANATPEDIENGILARNLYGLTVHESQLLTKTGTSPVQTDGVALDPGAIILATRTLPMAPAGTGVYQSVAHDPESGLAIRVSISYSSGALGVQTTIDVLYGLAILRQQKGILVLS